MASLVRRLGYVAWRRGAGTIPTNLEFADHQLPQLGLLDLAVCGSGKFVDGNVARRLLIAPPVPAERAHDRVENRFQLNARFQFQDRHNIFAMSSCGM